MRDWAKRILGYDTETTGTGPDARILEFGAVLQENAKVVTSFQVFLCPTDINWEDPQVIEALSINEIDPQDLVGRKTFAQEFDYIKHALTQADLRVGHNVKFDARMLRQEFQRAVEKGTLRQEDAAVQGNVITLDTLALDLHLNPNARGRSLAAVAERWDVHNWQKHRAIGDADACIRILMNMSDHLPEDLYEVATICKQCQQQWLEIMQERRNREAAQS